MCIKYIQTEETFYHMSAVVVVVVCLFVVFNYMYTEVSCKSTRSTGNKKMPDFLMFFKIYYLQKNAMHIKSLQLLCYFNIHCRNRTTVNSLLQTPRTPL